jgi:hypothetical protein
MENQTLTKSLNLHCPKFNCYKTIEAEYEKIKPENGSALFKLFSTKCKSENECFVVECPVKADLQNKQSDANPVRKTQN